MCNSESEIRNFTIVACSLSVFIVLGIWHLIFSFFHSYFACCFEMFCESNSVRDDVASSFYTKITAFFDIHFSFFLAIKRAESRLFTVFLCIKMEIFFLFFFF